MPVVGIDNFVVKVELVHVPPVKLYVVAWASTAKGKAQRQTAMLSRR
jgi:hypothetical protein